MKLLPCRSRECNALGAQLPPSRAFPRGEPHMSARYVSEYRCHRCGDPQQLTPADWNALRTLTRSEYERLGHQYHHATKGAGALRDLPTRDLEGAGLKRAHAADMFDAGMGTAQEVAELERRD